MKHLLVVISVVTGLSFFGFLLTVSDYAIAAAPAVVTNVLPTPSNGQVVLTWTNPADAGFTGTMVRYSTSAFPATTTDGTLAGDVAGSPSGTSTVTVTGLTNGTVYYFSLFSHNVTPEYSAAVNARQLVMPMVFSDDFQSDTVGAIHAQNGWSTVTGTWSVVDTAGEKTLQSSAVSGVYETNRVLNGGAVAQYSNQMLRVDWRSTVNNSPWHLFLRAQSTTADAGGYVVSQESGLLRLKYKTTAGATSVSMATGSFTPVANTWYTYEFSVSNNAAGLPVISVYAWARGTSKPATPTVTFTDTVNRIPQGIFSVGRSSTFVNTYDNVQYFGMLGDSVVRVEPGDTTNTLTWTNPTNAAYTGTVVRFSTTAYPTSVNDGTLLATVTGSSGGASSTIHTGLINGTVYYYSLFPYDSSGVYGTPSSLSQVPYAVLFSENFSALNTGPLSGQNGWTVPAGTWNVTDVASNRVVSATGTDSYITNQAANGNSETTNQLIRFRFQQDAPGTSGGYVWLRHQSNNDGYFLWHSSATAWIIGYRIGTSGLVNLATSATTVAYPLEAGAWYNVEGSIINNGSNLPVINLFVWREGLDKPQVPTLTVTDTVNRVTKGNFALGRNVTGVYSYFDDVKYYGAAPTLTVTSPLASVAGAPNVATTSIIDQQGTINIPYIQTSSTLNVAASLGGVGTGVEFILNEGQGSQQSIIDLTLPYTASFVGLPKGVYTLDSYALQPDGVSHFADPATHVLRTGIGIGDIITVIGDSVAEGARGTVDAGPVASWLDGDAGTVSADNRNFPQYGAVTGYGESYLTDLNDKLASYYGYPVFLMNEGFGGIMADTYQVSVSSQAAWQARQLALQPNKWIVALGNNEGYYGHTAGQFQTDMTSLINLLISTYGATASSIYVPYPVYDFRACTTSCATAAERIATFLPVIDSLRSTLGLAGGPDMWTTFEQHQGTDYFDDVHPNATGYIRMARLWALGFMKPTITSISAVDAHQATINWTSLSAYEPTIAGYRVKYGTSPTTLTQTVDFGNVTSGIVTGLTPDVTYYFAVQAFDNDPTDRSYSDESNAVSSATQTATTMTAATTADADGDGQIDRLDVSFSNDLDGATVSGVDFTVAGYTVLSATESSAGVITILLTESGTADTGATPTISLVGVVNDTFANFIDVGTIVASDSAAPVILSVAPTHGTTGVARQTTLSVAFSEPMDTTNVTYTISPSISGTVSVWSNSDKLLSVTHAVSMSSATDYELTVTAADDLTGNLLVGSAPGVTYPATFTTESGSTGSSSSPEAASISLNSPNGGEIYLAGEMVNVRWSTSGGELPSITVTYSIDGGISYRAIATGEADDGVYAWLVPDATSSRARILVQGTDEFGVIAQDGSVSDFSIVGSDVEEVPIIGNNIVVQGGGYAPSPFTGELELVETVRAGEYIRGVNYSTVYFIDALGVRHPFFNAQEFLTYGISFANTRVVSDATLPYLQLGTPMLPKPGVVLVKIVSNPRVYAIEVNPLDQFRPRLRWIPDEATAIALYGQNWAQFVIDIDETQLFRFGFGLDMQANESVETSGLIRREDLRAAGARFSVRGFFQKLIARIK